MVTMNQPLQVQMTTTTHRFRLALSAEVTKRLIARCYKHEVAKRGKTYKPTLAIGQAILPIAEFLTADNAKLGVLMMGLPGGGKTTMIRAIETMIDRLCEMGVTNTQFNLLTANKVAELARDTNRFNNFCNLPFVGIDDLGTEPSEIVEYGNVIKPLTQLLEYRYDRQLVTLVTTNLKREDITNRYGVRVADRFQETMEVVVFADPSFRR